MTRKNDPRNDPDALADAAKQGIPVPPLDDVSSETLVVYGDEPVDPTDATAEPPEGRYAAPQVSEPAVEPPAPTPPKKQERGRHRRE